MWEGYPPSPFDAEEAADIVGKYFADVVEDRWDDKLYRLETRQEVEAFCRHHFIPRERATEVEVPLWLTKRGVLLRALKEG